MWDLALWLQHENISGIHCNTKLVVATAELRYQRAQTSKEETWKIQIKGNPNLPIVNYSLKHWLAASRHSILGRLSSRCLCARLLKTEGHQCKVELHMWCMVTASAIIVYHMHASAVSDELEPGCYSSSSMPAVAKRLRRAYAAYPSNSDALNAPSFRRWRFDMKLSPFF